MTPWRPKLNERLGRRSNVHRDKPSQLSLSANSTPETAHASLWHMRSNCRSHPGQVNVCRSYSRACSAAGARLVRNVSPPQFRQRGLSFTPKLRGFRGWFNMRGPPTQFECRLSFENMSRGGQIGVARLVLPKPSQTSLRQIAMAKVVRQRSRVVAMVDELVARRVPQYVRVPKELYRL